MFWKRRKSKFAEPQEEPLFAMVRSQDEQVRRAHADAAATMPEFLEHVQRPGQHTCAAKLRFRDPEASLAGGKDCFAYMWLSNVIYDTASGTYIGTFFEVPPEFAKWHAPGQRLRFEQDDVFDWFVNDDGLMHGGFTLRVTRSRLPEGEREEFDKYTGVKHWVSNAEQ